MCADSILQDKSEAHIRRDQHTELPSWQILVSVDWVTSGRPSPAQLPRRVPFSSAFPPAPATRLCPFRANADLLHRRQPVLPRWMWLFFSSCRRFSFPPFPSALSVVLHISIVSAHFLCSNSTRATPQPALSPLPKEVLRFFGRRRRRFFSPPVLRTDGENWAFVELEICVVKKKKQLSVLLSVVSVANSWS